MSKVLDELELEDNELEYAIRKARGIILGYAMEYRAVNILKKMGFQQIKLVTSPTHDIEAVRDEKKYYIEVKASKYSPTRHYTAWKIAMIVLLDGEHYTLTIRGDNYKLEKTRDILSKPKQQLYDYLVKLKEANTVEGLEKQLEQYKNVIEWFKQQLTIRKLQEKQSQKYP